MKHPLSKDQVRQLTFKRIGGRHLAGHMADPTLITKCAFNGLDRIMEPLLLLNFAHRDQNHEETQQQTHHIAE